VSGDPELLSAAISVFLPTSTDAFFVAARNTHRRCRRSNLLCRLGGNGSGRWIFTQLLDNLSDLLRSKDGGIVLLALLEVKIKETTAISTAIRTSWRTRTSARERNERASPNALRIMRGPSKPSPQPMDGILGTHRASRPKYQNS
jgi:hypothetical protein